MALDEKITLELTLGNVMDFNREHPEELKKLLAISVANQEKSLTTDTFWHRQQMQWNKAYIAQQAGARFVKDLAVKLDALPKVQAVAPKIAKAEERSLAPSVATALKPQLEQRQQRQLTPDLWNRFGQQALKQVEQNESIEALTATAANLAAAFGQSEDVQRQYAAVLRAKQGANVAEERSRDTGDDSELREAVYERFIVLANTVDGLEASGVKPRIPPMEIGDEPDSKMAFDYLDGEEKGIFVRGEITEIPGRTPAHTAYVGIGSSDRGFHSGYSLGEGPGDHPTVWSPAYETETEARTLAKQQAEFFSKKTLDMVPPGAKQQSVGQRVADEMEKKWSKSRAVGKGGMGL